MVKCGVRPQHGRKRNTYPYVYIEGAEHEVRAHDGSQAAARRVPHPTPLAHPNCTRTHTLDPPPQQSAHRVCIDDSVPILAGIVPEMEAGARFLMET